MSLGVIMIEIDASKEGSMSNITLKVNGRSHTLDIEPATPLLYVLRNDLDLQGPKFGCGPGQCGACTVIINGAVRSCILPVSAVGVKSPPWKGFRPMENCTGCNRPGSMNRRPRA